MALLKSHAYHIHFYCELDQLPICQAVHDQMVGEVTAILGAGAVRSRAIGPQIFD